MLIVCAAKSLSWLLMWMVVHSYAGPLTSWGLVQSVLAGPGPVAAAHPPTPEPIRMLVIFQHHGVWGVWTTLEGFMKLQSDQARHGRSFSCTLLHMPTGKARWHWRSLWLLLQWCWRGKLFFSPILIPISKSSLIFRLRKLSTLSEAAHDINVETSFFKAPNSGSFTGTFHQAAFLQSAMWGDAPSWLQNKPAITLKKCCFFFGLQEKQNSVIWTWVNLDCRDAQLRFHKKLCFPGYFCATLCNKGT